LYKANLKFYSNINQLGRSIPKQITINNRFSTLLKSGLIPKLITFYPLYLFSRFAAIKIKMSEEQNLENLLQNADQLFDENHFQENVDLLSKYSDQDIPEIQWRKARAMYSLSKATSDAKVKETLVRDAFKLVSSALEKDECNFAIHKWYSIILDANSGLDGIKARITQLENVKRHMLKAVELNPNDSTSWHILGVFEYNLADLPWIQRKIVSTIFASPPTGTYEKALEFFEKAEELKEGFYTTNWLFIGKSHMALNNMEKAKVFIEKAANCQVLNEDDKNCKEEACKLLKKF